MDVAKGDKKVLYTYPSEDTSNHILFRISTIDIDNYLKIMYNVDQDLLLLYVLYMSVCSDVCNLIDI